jgi:phage terminase small subunit
MTKTMKTQLMNAPKYLSKEAQSLFIDTQTGWNISDSQGLTLLTSACKWLDVQRRAEKTLRREGMTVRDRFGQSRPHPCVEIARAASAELRACLKSLELDDEPQQNQIFNKNGGLKRHASPSANFPN